MTKNKNASSPTDTKSPTALPFNHLMFCNDMFAPYWYLETNFAAEYARYCSALSPSPPFLLITNLFFFMPKTKPWQNCFHSFFPILWVVTAIRSHFVKLNQKQFLSFVFSWLYICTVNMCTQFEFICVSINVKI